MQRSSVEKVIGSLRSLIELSQSEEERSWDEWVLSSVSRKRTSCWEKMKCGHTTCPAYENECGRCWLTAGTLCGDAPEGEFAAKYRSCTRCEVFRDAVQCDPVTELQESVLILVYGLRRKHQALQEALGEVKTLTGLLPICASCKKVREDSGYWKQIESYLGEHTAATFSHGICPDCAFKLYGD